MKKQLDCDREDACKAKFEGLYTRVNPMLQVSLKVAREKGASNWVTACPLFDHDTVLNKGEFVDAVYIRYGWTIPDLPSTVCVVPPSAFSMHLTA